MNIKIACLGGGSLYFPRVLADLALANEVAGSEVVLYDIDAEKAELMAGAGSRHRPARARHGRPGRCPGCRRVRSDLHWR